MEPLELLECLLVELGLQYLRGRLIHTGATGGGAHTEAGGDHIERGTAHIDAGGDVIGNRATAGTERVAATTTDLIHAHTHGNTGSTVGTVVKRRAHKMDRKVFVKNINFKTKQKALWDLFEAFGKVKHCRILKGAGQHRSRGLAIVTFLDEAGVQRALSASPEQLNLDDRDLVMEPAEWKERTRIQEMCEEDWGAGDSGSQLCTASTDEPFPARAPDRAELAEVSIDPMEAPIHMLNEDSLRTIFSYLSLREKVRVESVCRHWRQVALRSWWTLQRFDAGATMFSFRGIRDKDIKFLLHKTNPDCLQSVNLSAVGRLLTDTSLETIGRLCPNIKELDISKVAGTNRGLKFISEHCSGLERVMANNSFYFGEDGLWWLFHLCKELRYLSLINNKRLKGQCFHVMCRNLDTLVLTGCSKLQDVALSKVSMRCPYLTDLTLDECYKLTDTTLTHVAQGCKHLKRLSLNTVPDVSSAGLMLIAQFTELQELHLEFMSNQVTDHVLTTIANGCRHLKLLNLTCCYDVTDQGVSILHRCERLVELRLSYLHQVGDDGLLPVVRLGRLKKLICRGCGAFSDNVMVEVAAHCCLLEVLDISGCDQFSGAMLQQFVDTTPTRRTRLTIIAGGTSLRSEPDISCPTLCVSRVNLSDRRLRKDQDLFFDMGGFEQSDEDEDSGAEDMPMDLAQGWAHNQFDDDFLANDDPLGYERWDMS